MLQGEKAKPAARRSSVVNDGKGRSDSAGPAGRGGKASHARGLSKGLEGARDEMGKEQLRRHISGRVRQAKGGGRGSQVLDDAAATSPRESSEASSELDQPGRALPFVHVPEDESQLSFRSLAVKAVEYERKLSRRSRRVSSRPDKQLVDTVKKAATRIKDVLSKPVAETAPAPSKVVRKKIVKATNQYLSNLASATDTAGPAERQRVLPFRGQGAGQDADGLDKMPADATAAGKSAKHAVDKAAKDKTLGVPDDKKKGEAKGKMASDKKSATAAAADGMEEGTGSRAVRDDDASAKGPRKAVAGSDKASRAGTVPATTEPHSQEPTPPSAAPERELIA